jgi:hypothetical protein
MKKKYIGILFIATLFLLNIPILAAPCEHGIFIQGDGTTTSPWKVSTPEQVNHIRDHAWNHYELTNNIDMTNIEWVRIPGFGGSINGNDFTITNFNNKGKIMEGFIAGSSGVIQKLHIADTTLQGSGQENGVLAPFVSYNTGKVIACSSRNISVKSAPNSVGGVVGDNHGIVIYCANYSVGMRAGYTYGGVVSSNGWTTNKGKVMYCYNFGDSASYAGVDVGGIVGVNSAEVIGCGNFGNVGGTATVGGVVGILFRGGTIRDSFNASNNYNALAGGYWGSGGIIENCYNVGPLINNMGGILTGNKGHTIINSYNGTKKDVGTGTDAYNKPDEFMKSDELVNLLNAGREPALWIKGDANYPYPQHVGYIENTINIEHQRIGDNTDLVINVGVVTPPATWELLDQKTGQILFTGKPLTEYKQTLRFPLEGFNGDMQLVSRIRDKSKILHQSPVYPISKVNALSYSVSALLNENGMPKILLINDTDRYFENNVANQQLVQEIKKRSTGKILIYNTVSPVLEPLIER